MTRTIDIVKIFETTSPSFRTKEINYTGKNKEKIYGTITTYVTLSKKLYTEYNYILNSFRSQS